MIIFTGDSSAPSPEHRLTGKAGLSFLTALRTEEINMLSLKTFAKQPKTFLSFGSERIDYLSIFIRSVMLSNSSGPVGTTNLAAPSTLASSTKNLFGGLLAVHRAHSPPTNGRNPCGVRV